MRWVLRGSIVAWCVACLTGCRAIFACASSEECNANGRVGATCQPSGYCSFEDEDCESGQRYGELAPEGLAGTCVPFDGGETSGGDSIGGTTSTSIDASSASVTTLGTDESSVTAASESTTTPEPPCCTPGCPGSCDACEVVHLGTGKGGEAIGVAVIGEWVVWSTGFDGTVRIAEPDGSGDMLLSDLPGEGLATRIAADDSHVYVLDHGGPTVKRVAVPGGAADIVSEVAGGQAGFGRIAVGQEHVYFSMETSGGVWRAAKDLSNADAAEAVAPAVAPGDVAIDDTHVYWTDNDAVAVLRMDFADVGVAVEGERVVDAMDLSALAVDVDRIYYAEGGSVLSADKAGPNLGITTLATGQGWVWDMVVDETHVYWTDASLGVIVRAAKDGSGDAEELAQALTPWGLDVGCDAVYWADNGDESLRKRLK